MHNNPWLLIVFFKSVFVYNHKNIFFKKTKITLFKIRNNHFINIPNFSDIITNKSPN